MATELLGLPSQAVAILMIIFGILIMIVPALLPWLVGILLIIIGVLWLVGARGGMAAWGGGAATRPAGPTEPPRRV